MSSARSAPPGALRRPLVAELAWRQLTGKRSRLLTGTARAALLAIGLGVMAMVITMALMTGYQEELRRKLSGGTSAVLAIPTGPRAAEAPPEATTRLAELPGVAAVSPVILGRGSISAEGRGEGVEVTVRGVDPPGPGEQPYGLLGATAAQLSAGAEGAPGAVLGRDLAQRLGVVEGDRLRLVAVGFEDRRPRFRYRSLTVAGTFASGLSEFDRSWLVLNRTLAEELYGSSAGSRMVEIVPEDVAATTELAARAEEVLGPGFLVTNWLDLNRDLFAALELQKLVLFLGLGLIVFVSTFNVASTLVVAVRERMREIGVLTALGLPRRQISRVFLFYGLFLGLVGITAGVVLGCAVAWALDHFELIRFDAAVAEIYFIEAVRFEVRALDVLLVVAFALTINLLACAVPAWWASKVDPTRALRYE